MSWASTSIGLASKAYLLQHISANIRGAEEKKGKKTRRFMWADHQPNVCQVPKVVSLEERKKGKEERKMWLPSRETQMITATAYLLLPLSFVVDKNGRTECPASYLLHDFILLHPGLHSPFCIRSSAVVGSTTTVRAVLSTLLECR